MNPWRWLLLPHYLYFLLLPSLALVATAMLGEQRGVGSLCLFGLLPVTVFIALMAYCYTVPRSLPGVAFYVLAAPLLVTLSGWFGGGDAWRFITQITAVEIGAFAFALAYVELRERPLTQNSMSALLLLVVILFLLFSNVMPFAVLAWQNLSTTSPLSIGLLITAFCCAFVLHVSRIQAAARDYLNTVNLVQAHRLNKLTPAPPRLAGVEQALAATVVFLLIYLMTPMFSGFFIATAAR